MLAELLPICDRTRATVWRAHESKHDWAYSVWVAPRLPGHVVRYVVDEDGNEVDLNEGEATQ